MDYQGAISFYLLFLLITQSGDFIAKNEFVRLTFLLIWTIGLATLVINQSPTYFYGSSLVSLINKTENLIKHLETRPFNNPNAFSKSRKVRSQILSFLAVYSIISMISTVPIFLHFQNEIWPIGGLGYRLVKYFGGP